MFAVSGKSDGVMDLERYPGLGHELGASRTVMKRVFDNLGNGYFEIVATDGLYASREDFQLYLDHGSHLLVMGNYNFPQRWMTQRDDNGRVQERNCE